jgi:hypothetical protein
MATSRDDLADRSFFVEQARATLRQPTSGGVWDGLRREQAKRTVRAARQAASARVYRPTGVARPVVRAERRPRERRASRCVVTRAGSSRDGPSSRSTDDDPHLGRRLREGVAG